MMKLIPACAKCSIKNGERACQIKGGKGPAFCPTRNMGVVIEKANQVYSDPVTLEFARQASIQEAECYINRDQKPYKLHPSKTRLEEICEFAKKMGYNKLGLAFCGGLKREAYTLVKILESRGFEVASVICSVGCTPKEKIGIKDSEKIYRGQFEAMCSPIAQAEILNESGTDFNILLGLCVGHDSLFFKYAKALTTVFAVKDRVLGHNPLAALYTVDSYYERLK
ncbi:MAG: DUF1847 domain-containing protein [Bacillota bacterium]